MASEARRGLILGCGGTLGAAWTIAALREVAEVLAWDPRRAAVIVGTSAGAGLAALLGSGTSVGELLEAQLGGAGADPGLAHHFATPPRAWPPRPTARPTSLRLVRDRRALVALAGLAPAGRGDARFLDELVAPRVVTHPAVWIVAVDIETGQRVAFGAPGAPPASTSDAVRASWAIPGWFPPVEIGGRRYIDGGIVSPASADLVKDLGLDEVIVIAPMASSQPWRPRGLARVEALVRARMRRTLDAEITQLEARGTRVVRIEPGPDDLAVMGHNFMDGSRRLRVLESSLRTCRRTVGRALEGAHA